MTVPTISNLPTVPATSDPNFETEAPALFNHIKNTFVSEMNSAISFINSSTFDATVEFKNANFTAARNFLYMIDTSSAAVSVTLPANPSTGDQLLLMDQKRYFATNNLTIGRNGKNINGAASNVVSKSTGALIRCIYNSTYGWTVDLYEGQWESGTSAGDLVYTGGNVGIGTSSPDKLLHIAGVDTAIVRLENTDLSLIANQLIGGLEFEKKDSSGAGAGVVGGVRMYSGGTIGEQTYMAFSTSDSSTNDNEVMRISHLGNVGIGTSSPAQPLHVLKANGAAYGVFDSYREDQFGGGINIAHARGTQSLPDFLDTNDYLGLCSFGGWQGSGFARYAEVHALATQNHSATAGGTKLILQTTANNTTTKQNRLVIDHDGRVGIGTSDPGAKLDISATSSPGGVLRLSNTSAGILPLETAGRIEFYNSDITNGAGVHAKIESVAVNFGADYRMDFYTGDITPNHVLTLGHTGNVEVKTGNLVIGTAGKGIDFSATSGTGTSELLTDYEEGNFTPTVSGTWTTNPTSLSGKYTKIGRMVYIQVEMTGGVKSSAISGYLTGLPIAVASSGTGSVTNVDVQDLGNCLFANTDRIWFTATNLGTAKIYITGQYIAS